MVRPHIEPRLSFCGGSRLAPSQRLTTEHKSKNIYWSYGYVARDARERMSRQRSATVWFTGLSAYCKGKSTLTRRVEKMLIDGGWQTYVLDGDNLRHGLNRDLGFSPEDWAENIWRVGEVARLFTDYGAIVRTAFISRTARIGRT